MQPAIMLPTFGLSSPAADEADGLYMLKRLPSVLCAAGHVQRHSLLAAGMPRTAKRCMQEWQLVCSILADGSGQTDVV